MDDSDAVVLDIRLDDEVGDTGSVSEGRDVTADLVEGYDEVLGKHAGDLALGLVADNSNGRGGVDVLLLEGAAGRLCDGGVDTTTHALVRRDDDEELALANVLGGCMLEDLCREEDGVGDATFGRGFAWYAPEFAMPYSLPAWRARCALASFVEAITFMDCLPLQRYVCSVVRGSQSC